MIYSVKHLDKLKLRVAFQNEATTREENSALIKLTLEYYAYHLLCYDLTGWQHRHQKLFFFCFCGFLSRERQCVCCVFGAHTIAQVDGTWSSVTFFSSLSIFGAGQTPTRASQGAKKNTSPLVTESELLLRWSGGRCLFLVAVLPWLIVWMSDSRSRYE